MTKEKHNKKVENIRISLDKQFKKQMRLLAAQQLLTAADGNLSGALNALLKAYGFINRQLEEKIVAVAAEPKKEQEQDNALAGLAAILAKVKAIKAEAAK